MTSSGHNPTSVPPGVEYKSREPEQSLQFPYVRNSNEAFVINVLYWSSSEHPAAPSNYAVVQYFVDGLVRGLEKHKRYTVRPVRRDEVASITI